MSMPNIPDIDPNISICFADVINLLISSIALEEISLSNIINAESEKLCFFLQNPNNIECKKDIFKINESIERVLQNVEKIESLLIEKMKLVMQMYDFSDPCNIEILNKSCNIEKEECPCSCNYYPKPNVSNIFSNMFCTKKRKNT